MDSSDFAKRAGTKRLFENATRRGEEGRGRKKREREREKSKVGYNDEKIQRAKEEVKRRNVKRRKGRLKPAERTRKNGSLAAGWRGKVGCGWGGGKRARKVARDKALNALRGAAGAPGAVVGG